MCLTGPANRGEVAVQAEYIGCGLAPRKGFRSFGKVVGYTRQYFDNLGEPEFLDCPPAITDEIVRAWLPSGRSMLLCLDKD